MNWGQISELFLRTVGNEQIGLVEQWMHLNEAHRQLCGALELPQLHVRTILSTTANQDWVAFDGVNVYAIDWIVQRSTGRKLDPEPSGERGRSRFFEIGQERPPLAATITFYVHRGARIYLRDTPNTGGLVLDIAYRKHPSDIINDGAGPTLTEEPELPAQYHMAVAQLAAGLFFEFHPPSGQDGVPDYTRSSSLIAAAQGKVQTLRNPVAEEQKDRRDFLMQGGYNFDIGGR